MQLLQYYIFTTHFAWCVWWPYSEVKAGTQLHTTVRMFTAVFTGREHGPWTQVVCTGLYSQSGTSVTVAGAGRCDHILHCLPVRRWVEYKVVSLQHQSLSGPAPTYFADDTNHVADSSCRLLQSAVDMTCVVPHTAPSIAASSRS